MSVLDCPLICLIAYAAFRVLVEVYWAIRMAGFERGLMAAEPVIEQATKTAYRIGRMHQMAATQQAVTELSREAYKAGRQSVMYANFCQSN